MPSSVWRWRAAPAIGLAAWLIWAALIIGRYYVVPDDPVRILDDAIWPVPHWREALVRAARGIGGAAIVIAAAWGAGGVLRRWLGAPARGRAELALFRLALGFAAVTFTSLALAGLGLFRPPVVMALVTAAALVALTGQVAASWRELRWPRRPAARVSVFDLACLGVATLAAALAFVAALAPEIEYDALWYHLWLPVKWLEAGRPVDLVDEYISLYPLTWDLVFGAAYVTGGAVGAKLMHFICLPLLAAATWMLCRRAAPDASPALAVALAVTPPIVIWESTTAYVDLALAWYLALAVYALLRHDEVRDRRWLVLGAVMMGMALAIKHLALVALAIAASALVIRERRVTRRLAPALRVAVLFVALAILLPSPWYARAWLASGNPVFPDLYGVFGAEPAGRWSEATERGLQAFKDRFGRDRTVSNLLVLPWDMTLHGTRYGGTLGPLFLILLPAAAARLARRRPAGALASIALGAAAYVAIWASPIGSFQMRFLVPLVPFLSVLAAEGVRQLRAAAESVSRAAAPVVGAVVLGLLAMNLPPFTAWHEADRREWSGWLTHVVRAVPAAVVLGARSQDAYLSSEVASYRAWTFINVGLPADARVLTFAGGDHLYSARRRLWSDSAAARPLTWDAPPGRETWVAAGAKRLGLTHVLFDKRLEEPFRLAIGSERMRACCLERIYEDNRFALYRLQ